MGIAFLFVTTIGKSNLEDENFFFNRHVRPFAGFSGSCDQQQMVTGSLFYLYYKNDKIP
jgi:hypothetical protein